VGGQRLLNDGKLAQADVQFAKVADFYGKKALHDPVAANNCALALRQRYFCTGDTQMLVQARQRLEAAVRLIPDNTIAIANLATMAEYAGEVDVLGNWIDTESLRLSDNQAEELLGLLVHSPLKSQLAEMLRGNPSMRRARELVEQELLLAPNRPRGYEKKAAWLLLQEDHEGLAILHERISGLQLDLSSNQKARGAFRSGEQDALLATSVETALARLNGEYDALAKRGSKPTLAALHALRGARYHEQVVLHRDGDAAKRSVAEYRAAEAAWPELGTEIQLAWALVMQGIMEAAEKSPPLAALFEQKVRDQSAGLILHSVSQAPEAEAMLAALRAQPQMKEAASLLRASTNRKPNVETWLLARLIGDKELEKISSAVFNREDLRQELEIYYALDPEEGLTAQKRLAIVKAGPPPE